MKKDVVLKILSLHKNEIKQYGVNSLALFGSVARGEEVPESDLDLLVEFDPEYKGIGLFAFLRLRYRLEELLNSRVDLVTPQALKHQLRDRILKEAIYAG
jgi:predicted nucleotidyltransferase